MSTKPEETTISNVINLQKKNSGSLTSHYTKMDSISKMDSYLKKLYLPSIQKKSIPSMRATSFNRRLLKSQSYTNMTQKDKTTYINNNNKEKEKLMLSKLSLLRINTQINDLMFNYKKLLLEKEENINIIKEAISINDPSYFEEINSKIEQMVEDTLKNNRKTFTTNNYNNESIKYTDDKLSKNEDNKINNINNKNISKDTSDYAKIKPINSYDEKISEKNGIKEENKYQNQIINNEEKQNKEENKNNEENKNENKSNEENKNIDKKSNNTNANNNSNNNDVNNEQNHKNDNSVETREEDMNKMNSINNSHLANNSSLNNMLNNNSLEEQINNIKEIIEEKDEEKITKEENYLQIDSGLFEKSAIPSKLYNVLKVKSELSAIKHKIINIQQQIKLKDEEITDIKSKSTMKNIIYQSNILGSKMVTLKRIKIKNKEFEELSYNLQNIQKQNLKKELEYYSKINKSFVEENKGAGENYLKMKNQFDANTKNFSNLEEKNNNLKYKFNAIRLNDLKKQIELDKLKGKIEQIEDIKNLIEYDKKTIEDKKKEIEDTKKKLEEKINEVNKMKENKEKKYSELNKLQRETNSKIYKQKNEIIKIKNEIKEIDKIIFKELDKYNTLNINNKKSENLKHIYRDKPIKDFLNYIKELRKEENKNYNEIRRKNFQKLKKSENQEFTQIAKYKNIQKGKEINSTESLPLLEEKLEYYLNSKGEKVEKSKEKK